MQAPRAETFPVQRLPQTAGDCKLFFGPLTAGAGVRPPLAAAAGASPARFPSRRRVYPVGCLPESPLHPDPAGPCAGADNHPAHSALSGDLQFHAVPGFVDRRDGPCQACRLDRFRDLIRPVRSVGVKALYHQVLQNTEGSTTTACGT